MKIINDARKKDSIIGLVEACFKNVRLLNRDELSIELEKHLPLTVSSYKLEGINDEQDRLTLGYADGDVTLTISWRKSSLGDCGMVIDKIE